MSPTSFLELLVQLATFIVLFGLFDNPHLFCGRPLTTAEARSESRTVQSGSPSKFYFGNLLSLIDKQPADLMSWISADGSPFNLLT